jgi:hypothetical protein
MWINPSKRLVDHALEKWSSMRLRADNISVVTLMLDPPGPTHNEVGTINYTIIIRMQIQKVFLSKEGNSGTIHA